MQPPPILCLDHAAVGVRDLSRSVLWYQNVLGFVQVLAHDPNFTGEIAMMGFPGNAMLALLRLPADEGPLAGSRSQRGHFALRTTPVGFSAWRERLPQLLQAHRIHEGQSLWIQEDDYGRQQSLFFFDPDENEIEVTTWTVPLGPQET